MSLLLNQFDEFGVQPNHLKGKSHLVDDALPRTMSAGKEFKVLNPVVLSVPVDVVNGFLGEKFPAKAFGHDVTVFKNFSLFSGSAGKRWDGKPNVTAALKVPAGLARIKFLGRSLLNPFNSAFFRANALLGVKTASGFAARVFSFSAVNANVSSSRVGILAMSDTLAGQGTIHRVAIKFLSICSQVCSQHRKRLIALFADEFNGDTTSGRKFFVESMGGPARKTAIFASLLGLARVAVKRISAVLARKLDSHGDNSLFTPWSMPCSLVVVK